VGTAISPADADGAAGVPAEQIEAVEVMKLAPGRVGPDAMQAIWVRLKGADVRPSLAAPTGTRFRATLRTGERTATLQALGADGQPMGAPRMVVLRPTMRASRDTTVAEPLYFVDGVEHTGGSDGLPKPDRIESIDVLKGANAIARYGERGANGVVVIRTKP
jgi:TonB-dependent SusC/RagA subfamily outer membrane receptor